MIVSARAWLARAMLLLIVSTGLTVVGSLGTPAANAVATYRVLVAGDSISQGSSGDYTWRYRLWAKLNSTAAGDVEFVGTRNDLYDNVNNVHGSQYYAASFAGKAHASKWGTAYQLELDNIASQVTSSNANVLVAMLGSNDLAYLTSPAQTIQNVRTYISRARAARPGIDIVVGQVLTRWDPFTQETVLASESAAYATALQSLASELNTVTQRVVVAPTRNGWNPAAHTWDGTHPNPTGERFIAQRVSEGLAAIGVGTASPSIIAPQSWSVPGPAPTLSSGSEAAAITWSRTSTGATGMYIDQRLVNTSEPWRRLPYAVSGSGWTATLLAAGGTYQYRLAPTKGFITGIPGPSSTVVAGGPTPGAIANVTLTAVGGSPSTGQRARFNWSQSTNATGYLLSYATARTTDMQWTDLPYAVPDLTFTVSYLEGGRYYRARVKPTRGYLSPGWKSSAPRRTNGVAFDRVHVALGDSYSSGLGGSGNLTNGACLRYDGAWPFLTQSSATSHWAHLACEGGQIPDVDDQLPSMDSALDLRPSQAHLITVTVGGNDVGFAGELARCATSATPCHTRESMLLDRVDGLASDMTSLFTSIRSRAPYADIVAVGYPTPVEPGYGGGIGVANVCDAIDSVERETIHRVTLRLNSRIAISAANAGIWNAGLDTQNFFAGHGACGPPNQAWVNGPVLNLPLGGVDEKSFHPNDAGQSAYAIVVGDTISARSGN